MAPSPSRIMTGEFFPQLKACGHRLYVTSSGTRMGFSLVNRLRFAFVKCSYRTYNMLLKIRPCALYTSPLLVQTLQLTGPAYMSERTV
jgi:hypothetical protein